MPDRRSLVANASSARQVRKADAYLRTQHRQLLVDLADVLGTAAGVRAFTTLLERWSFFADVFSPDALVMAHRAGQQEVAHQLMALAGNARDDAVPNIMAEHARRQRDINNLAGQADKSDDAESSNEEDDA